jgi:hypothetical protein
MDYMEGCFRAVYLPVVICISMHLNFLKKG